MSYLFSAVCLIAIVIQPQQAPLAGAAQQDAGVYVGEATVQFIAEIDIPALSSGQVTAMNVREFQSITKDAVIASLDDRTLRDRQKITEIGRQLLSNKLNSDLQKTLAETSIREARIRHEANLSSQASSPGSIPALELTRSSLALKRAELEAQSVNEQKEDLLLELNIKDAEVARVQHELKQLSATCPVSGVVLSVAKQTGEWVNIGETIATVARMDRLQIPVILNEQQLLHREAGGTSVVVQWQEKDNRYSLRGTIVLVEPIFRAENAYRAIVEIENRMLSESAGWLLNPGRKVNVTVYPQTQKQPTNSPATARLLNTPAGSSVTPIQR